MTLLSAVILAIALVPGRQGATPTDDVARWRAYHERIVTVAASSPGQVSLTAFLGQVFELAETRGAAGNTIVENRAAILALTVYVNNWPVEAFIPEARTWPRALRRTTVLSGRHDLAQHFIVSALIAAANGTPLAQAAGVYKEISDARRGSGFSFSDLAADQAGTRFGELATQSVTSASRLYARIGVDLAEADLMPSIAGLPDNLPEAEFTRRFGGVGAPAYNELVAEIDRRVAALALLQ